MKLFMAILLLALFASCASQTHFFQHPKRSPDHMITGIVDSVYTTVWTQKRPALTREVIWIKVGEKHIVFQNWYNEYKKGDVIKPNTLYVRTFLARRDGNYAGKSRAQLSADSLKN